MLRIFLLPDIQGIDIVSSTPKKRSWRWALEWKIMERIFPVFQKYFSGLAKYLQFIPRKTPLVFGEVAGKMTRYVARILAIASLSRSAALFRNC